MPRPSKQPGSTRKPSARAVRAPRPRASNSGCVPAACSIPMSIWSYIPTSRATRRKPGGIFCGTGWRSGAPLPARWSWRACWRRWMTRYGPSGTALTQLAEGAAADGDVAESAAPLRHRGVKIGVFCSSLGNFFMREIADLLAWGLQAEGIDAVQRDENANRDERFNLRIFVAPHEFFWLGKGRNWTEIAAAPGSVLYNVEQPQTQWFCRAFPLLL